MGKKSVRLYGVLKPYPARFLSGLKTLVLPDRCMVCGRYIGPGPPAAPLGSCFCPQCLDLPLPHFSSPYCPCCGHLFPQKDQKGHLCEPCLKSRPELIKVRAAFAYEGIIRTAVGLLKYQGRIRLARPLGDHLYQSFEHHFSGSGIDLILPIPLHPARAWERQFNQSLLLVRDFFRTYRRRKGRPPTWRICPELLRRIRVTKSQTGLDGKMREKNLRSAFALKSEGDVRDKKVLLVDDVYTSGATCRSAARTLLAAGARQVDALVLARA